MGSTVADYAYDDLGHRVSLNPYDGQSPPAPTGAATAWGWDGADRLTSLSQGFTAGTNNVAFTFGFDAACWRDETRPASAAAA